MATGDELTTAKQTIIVSKAHPSVRTLGDAQAIARRYADRLYTHRETASSFRFRQRPPEDFVEGSFRTKRVTSYVSIVVGTLKPRRA